MVDNGGCRHCSGFNRTSELFKLARNFATSVFNVMKYAAETGQVVAHKRIVTDRLKICYVCEHRMTRDRCKICGCFIKAKAGLAAEKCPDGRW